MLPFADLQAAFAATPLFEAKTWQLSPDAWPLSRAQVAELERIGRACYSFHQALENLYLRAAAGKNLLRNRTLLAPWVVNYLDRGKPADLVAHARDAGQRGTFPLVLRPDLLLTDTGWAMTELDSVPGGIGLTAFLNRLYAKAATPATSPATGTDAARILGGDDAMIRHFHASLAAQRPDLRNPLIAILVSDESATYRPEMMWLAEQLQRRGLRVFCLDPDDVFPLGGSLFFDVEGSPERVDIIHRFFELFDLPSLHTAPYMFEALKEEEVALAPPMRPFQEEKLMLALFHHHLLQDYWAEVLDKGTRELLRTLIPTSWVIDPAPLPPGAVLDGPRVGGRALTDWRQLSAASQKERDLILKISGYHETAWGARSVVLGSDCSREEWQGGVELAISDAPTHLHVLQEFRKPRRVRHRVYDAATGEAREVDGRLRLCPYYFVIDGQPKLSGALATFCPPDKKIIHGMQDAALLPCEIVD